ncbi:hypothetical protein Tco_0777939 [Tanacetum coccineum]
MACSRFLSEAQHGRLIWIRPEGNAEFHEIIDFLKRSSIHHALTVSPVVSTTFVEQFWTSAKSKTINNVRHITAKVAGKSVSISEASIRSDLLFDDADGIDSLPNQAIFDAIQLIGHLDAKKKFVMYPRFISIFLDKQLANVSVPLDHFPVNTLTSKVFSFMVKKGKHFSGKVTPLFATMLVQPTQDEGAPSERPSEAQPTPSPAPTSEVPNEPQTDSSPAQTSEVPIEQQTDLSPRPSPTPIIPDSIPETSGENLGGHSSSDKSLSGNEGDMTLQSVYDLCLSLCAQVSDQAKEIQLLKGLRITKLKKQAKPVIKHHRAWLKSVSLKQRFPSKSFSKKHRVHKESVSKQGRKFAKGESSVQGNPLFDEIPEDTVDHMETENAQDEGRTREMVDEDKEINENILSTEDVLSTDKEGVSTDMEKVSTDRPIVSTDGSKVSTDRHIESNEEHIEGTEWQIESTEEHIEGTEGQIEGTEEQLKSTDGQRKGTEDHTEEETPTQTTLTPTQTPTSTIFRDDETIRLGFLNMSVKQAVVSRGKGERLIQKTKRKKKLSGGIDPKDKGKKKIEEEDESESESDGIPEAEKKFKQLESDEEMARKIQEEWEGEEERNRIAEEKATNEALIRNFDDIKARIEADRLLAEKLQEQEREQFTIEERAKFLHDTIAAQRKFLAQQRSEAIRNRPPTKNQLRNQMMTYLKHVGNFKHSELKIKKFEEIQALYEKIKRSDEDFISIGSAEDERLIKRMNEKGVDSSKSEVIKEENKEEAKEENKEEESTRKRKLGTRKKMKSRKRRFIQNTSEDDSEKENDELRLHLTIAPDEEKEVDYEILDRKYPIKEWKTECLGTKPQADKAEHLEEINQNVVIRSNGQKRYFSTLMRVLSIFDREDLNAVYQLVMDRYQDEIPEGFDRVLWGDLMVMFNPDDENEFWNSQQDWNIVSWKLHSSSGVHTLVTEIGLVIHMLVEKKYPLRKKVLVQMLKLKLESEEDSTMALELIKFVKKLLAEHKNWLVHKQTACGKDFSNPFMVDNLPKIVRFSTHLASLLLQEDKVAAKKKDRDIRRSRNDNDICEVLQASKGGGMQIVSTVLNLQKVKDAQAKEIDALKKRIQRLERRKMSRPTGLKRLSKVGMSRRVESSEDQESLGAPEDASKQRRSIEDIDADVDVSLVDETQERQNDDLIEKNEQSTKLDDSTAGEAVTTASVEDSAAPTIQVSTADIGEVTAAKIDELTLAQTLIEIKAAKPKVVTTAATTTTTTRPKGKGVVVQEPSEFRVPQESQPSISKDKGKGIMVEPEVPLKRKDQIALDEQIARDIQAKLDAELEEEQKLARKQEEEANIALIESWENTQAMMEADRLLAERLQSKEREELTDEEKGKLFMELMEKRRKHFAALRAQEKRNRPPTKAQKRTQMSTYLKHMEEDKEFDEVEEVSEDDEGELLKHLVIKKDEDIAIDAILLATKL